MTTTRLTSDAAEALDNYLDSPATDADLTKTGVVSDAVLAEIPDEYHPAPAAADADNAADAQPVADGGRDADDYRCNWQPRPLTDESDIPADLPKTWKVRAPVARARYTASYDDEIGPAGYLRAVLTEALDLSPGSADNYVEKYPFTQSDWPDDGGLWRPLPGVCVPAQELYNVIVDAKKARLAADRNASAVTRKDPDFWSFFRTNDYDCDHDLLSPQKVHLGDRDAWAETCREQLADLREAVRSGETQGADTLAAAYYLHWMSEWLAARGVIDTETKREVEGEVKSRTRVDALPEWQVAP